MSGTRIRVREMSGTRIYVSEMSGICEARTNIYYYVTGHELIYNTRDSRDSLVQVSSSEVPMGWLRLVGSFKL